MAASESREHLLGSLCPWEICLGHVDEDMENIAGNKQAHRIAKVGKDLQAPVVQPSPNCYYHPLDHVPKHQVPPFLKHELP